MTDRVELAARLFRAFAEGDDAAARDLLAPDFVGVQNGGPAMDRETLLRFAGAFRAVVRDYRYENVTCVQTDTGFVEEHDVCGTLADGTQVRLPACVVAEVRDGKIEAIREYFDSVRVTAVAKALGTR